MELKAIPFSYFIKIKKNKKKCTISVSPKHLDQIKEVKQFPKPNIVCILFLFSHIKPFGAVKPLGRTNDTTDTLEGQIKLQEK